MKYADLVTPTVMNKLMSYSFARNGVDISIYRFSKAIDSVFEFVDSQRRKIIESHGSISQGGEVTYKSSQDIVDCTKEIGELLESNVEFAIPILDVCENDFDPLEHRRSQYKENWIAPIEIKAILNLAELTRNSDYTKP